MTEVNVQTGSHPTEAQLADFLEGLLDPGSRQRVEDHIASCDECLRAVVSAHESVESFRRKEGFKKFKEKFMKKINIYLALALMSFALSFAVQRYFAQFLVATLLLGVKWIVDAKTTRMLVMIYEAWKKGGEKEASRILSSLDSERKDRF